MPKFTVELMFEQVSRAGDCESVDPSSFYRIRGHIGT